MKQKFIALLFAALAVFAFMPVSVSANCVGATQTFTCGQVVTESCTLDADMDCSAVDGNGIPLYRHGLIIGAAGITIDGAGFTINGGGTDNRDCAVNVYEEELADRIWCVGHPCRTADLLVGGVGDTDPNTSNGCLDSGIVNANTLAHNSCNAAAPVGQGGCDNVTIKNLEITGWCDGIWISGDCEPIERRLTGIVVEGNVIHDNGKDGCGTFTESTGGDGGDWTNRYYTDAIFTAQVGLDAGNSPEWAVADGLPVVETVLPVNDGINGGNKTFYDWWSAFDVAAANAKPNHIIHNDIWNQTGCGCTACAGGMGINLQGGLEIDDVIWAGGNNIGSNNIRNCAMSAISNTHASKHNRIHHNYCLENKFGGISAGCGWNHDNYLFSNTIEHNEGMGIGQASSALIVENKVVSTHTVPAGSQLRNLGWPYAGYGILLGGDAGTSVLEQNYVSVNEAADIVDSSSTATGSRNACVRAGSFGPGCDFAGCPPFASLCRGDITKNGMVDTVDKGITESESGKPCRACAPGVARCPVGP